MFNGPYGLLDQLIAPLVQTHVVHVAAAAAVAVFVRETDLTFGWFQDVVREYVNVSVGARLSRSGRQLQIDSSAQDWGNSTADALQLPPVLC